ncbi:carboxypeptidase regulatory-like domain-containing protein [Candidatus Woesearchaeota archaeon]|nr:carboxypeptidase regulatory-like domain-containing protein [Candidatus Woesearchaeota archaeon]
MRGRELFLLFILLVVIVSADQYGGLDSNCVQLCNAEDYEGATKCFRESRDPPSAYLATATCAFNAYKDAAAEEYALKAAGSYHEWTTFLNKFGKTFIYTGGLGETYTLAYVASGGARHESKAMQYLRTSRQCQQADDTELCATQYFNSVVARYQQRNIQGARVAYTKTGQAFQGKITDTEGHPIKHAKITLVCGATTASRYLDANGNYKFTAAELNITSPMQLCTEAKIFVKLEYHDPTDKDEIKFVYLWNSNPVYFYKKFNLASEADLTQNFQLNESLPAAQYGGLPNDLTEIDDFGISYYEMARVYEYYRDILKVDMKYKMPVHVLMFVGGTDSTHYTPEPANSRIVIRDIDSDKSNSNRPKNREWHEFSHFVQYNNYGKWPQPPAGSAVPEVNHNGYSNPNTADSFCEGFAEFMPLMIAKHYGEADWRVYASWGNMDKKIKAWQNYGRSEEMAVSATFLDLVDPKDDDNVEIPFMDLWDIIKDYRQNNYVVYTAVKQKFDKQKDAIDLLYINNGFFNDKTRGNGSWEPKESWHNLNHDNVIDANELRIDYAQEPNLGRPWMIRQDNEEPGYSANYQRAKRENAVRLPGHFIKVNNKVPLYKVKVTFADNPEYNYDTTADNINGMIFFEIPSWENNAKIIVEPIGVKFTKPLEFTSLEFEAAGNKPLEQGYFVEHNFGITDSVPQPAAITTQTLDDDIPYWETKDLVAKPEDYKYTYVEQKADYEKGEKLISTNRAAPKSGFFFIWIIVGIALILIVILILSLGKKKKHRK